jgi:hypothetical protein
MWPGGTWSREAARASARTQLTRSPTAARVQPDPPAGRQPSGGRHLRRPAPGTSRRETSCVTGRVLLTPARARLMAACRPAVPRSAYAPSGGPLLANPPPAGRPRPSRGMRPQRCLGPSYAPQATQLGTQAATRRRETRQGSLRESYGPAAPPWTGSSCRAHREPVGSAQEVSRSRPPRNVGDDRRPSGTRRSCWPTSPELVVKKT